MVLEISRRRYNTSKCRYQDEDIVFHCWIAGFLEGRSHDDLRDEEEGRKESDIRKTGIIASKWRSFDVI